MSALAAAMPWVCRPASASEDGTQHYPIGVNTIADGNLPPPGMLQLLSYSQISSNLNTMDGTGAAEPLHFKLNTAAEAVRLLYTWKFSVGPFHYTTGIIQPMVDLHLSVLGTHGRDVNFGDLDVQNFLGYSTKDRKLSLFFGTDTYIPTGHYQLSNLINTGMHYWTEAPSINASYNPSKKLELSGTLIAEFNGTNTATHYHSGADLDFDYGITFRPFASIPNLGFGPQGYFYKQLGDDTINRLAVSADGDRGREFAAGPQVRYDIPFGAFMVKYQQEFAVKNRPKGQKVWFQFAMPLH